jgi:hypothetical protein
VRFAAARLTSDSPAVADVDRASIGIENDQSGLRAGDALHLAICARNASTLCTADETLASAAVALGLPVARVK